MTHLAHIARSDLPGRTIDPARFAELFAEETSLPERRPSLLARTRQAAARLVGRA